MGNALPSDIHSSEVQKKYILDPRRVMRSIYIGRYEFEGDNNGVYEKYPLKATLKKEIMEDSAGNYSIGSYVRGIREYPKRLMKVCSITIELEGKDNIEVEIVDTSNNENQGLSQVTVRLGKKSEDFTVSRHNKEVFKSNILTNDILDIISQIWKLPSTEEVMASVTKELAGFWRVDPNSVRIQQSVADIMKDYLPPYKGN